MFFRKEHFRRADVATVSMKHKLSEVAQRPYEVTGARKSTITIRYVDKTEENSSRDGFVLGPISMEHKVIPEAHRAHELQNSDALISTKE